MDCKEAQLLTVPYILGDLDPNSRQCGKLEAHLQSCSVCAKEYENNKCVVEFIGEHTALFAEAFETIDKKRAAEQKETKRSWQAIQAKLAKIEVQEKQAKFHRFLVRVSAAAACIAVGIFVWLVLSNSKTPEKPNPQQIALAPTPSIKIELLLDNGNIIIPAGMKIKTTANELKTLIINGKHRMVLNYDTALSIEPLIDYERVGCMVKLDTGEIFTHVEHDGNPFVVGTAQGRAIITGTTFDIKATDISTTLVVAEGTVHFGSEEGFVEVRAGHTSEIAEQSAPTKPGSCNTTELTAWATGYELKAVLAQIEPYSDGYDLTDLWLSAVSGPIELESMNYEDWIEEKRPCFKREFPWTAQLQSALAAEGIKVDYPQLLISSGDIWQFLYPETSPRQIPILHFDSLLKAASKYGFDEQWLTANLPIAKSAQDSSVIEGIYTGQKAFEHWANCLEKLQQSQKPPDPGTLLSSLHAAVYLANTRTLVWLSLMNSKPSLPAEDKAQVLALLQTEVNTANELTGRIIRLFVASENQPCDEYQELLGGIIDRIGIVAYIENELIHSQNRMRVTRR